MTELGRLGLPVWAGVLGEVVVRFRKDSLGYQQIACPQLLAVRGSI